MKDVHVFAFPFGGTPSGVSVTDCSAMSLSYSIGVYRSNFASIGVGDGNGGDGSDGDSGDDATRLSYAAPYAMPCHACHVCMHAWLTAYDAQLHLGSENDAYRDDEWHICNLCIESCMLVCCLLSFVCRPEFLFFYCDIGKRQGNSKSELA